MDTMRRTFSQAPTQKLTQDDDDFASQQSLSLQFSSQNLKATGYAGGITGVKPAQVVGGISGSDHRVKVNDRKKLSSIRTPLQNGSDEDEDEEEDIDVDAVGNRVKAIVDIPVGTENSEKFSNSSQFPATGTQASVDLLDEKGIRNPTRIPEDESSEDESQILLGAHEAVDETIALHASDTLPLPPDDDDRLVEPGGPKSVEGDATRRTVAAPTRLVSTEGSPQSDEEFNLTIPADRLQSTSTANGGSTRVTPTELVMTANPTESIEWRPQRATTSAVASAGAKPFSVAVVESPSAIAGSASMLDDKADEGENEADAAGNEAHGITPSEATRNTVSATLLSLGSGRRGSRTFITGTNGDPTAKATSASTISIDAVIAAAALTSTSSQDEFAFKGAATKAASKKNAATAMTATPRSSELPEMNASHLFSQLSASEDDDDDYEDDLKSKSGKKKKKSPALKSKRLVFAEASPVAEAKSSDSNGKSLRNRSKNSSSVNQDVGEDSLTEEEALKMWNTCWIAMKQKGWSHRPGSGIVEWVYLAPGVDRVSQGVLNSTMFHSVHRLMNYIKLHDPEITALHELPSKPAAVVETKSTGKTKSSIPSTTTISKSTSRTSAASSTLSRAASIEDYDDDDDEDEDDDGGEKQIPDDENWDLLYNEAWPKIKSELGWKYRAGGGLVDWVYVPPGVSNVQLTSVEAMFKYIKQEMPDFFASILDGILQRREQEKKERRKALREAERAEKRAMQVKKQRKEQVEVDDDDEEEKEPEPRRLETEFTWDMLWKHLKQVGWTYKAGRGLVSWYYILPGVVKEEGVRHVDYFISTLEVFDYCSRHPQVLKGLQTTQGEDACEVKWDPSSYVANEAEENSPPKRARSSVGSRGGDAKKKEAEDDTKTNKTSEKVSNSTAAEEEELAINKVKSKKAEAVNDHDDDDAIPTTNKKKIVKKVVMSDDDDDDGYDEGDYKSKSKKKSKIVEDDHIPTKKSIGDASSTSHTTTNPPAVAAANPSKRVLARSSKTPPAIRKAQLMKEESVVANENPDNNNNSPSPAKKPRTEPLALVKASSRSGTSQQLESTASPSKSSAAPAMKIISTPTSVSSTTSAQKKVFAGIGFNLTGFDSSPGRGGPSMAEITKLIEEQGGGTIVKTTNWGPPSDIGLNSVVLVAKPGSYRTEKYVCSITKQKPVFHSQWIVECVNQQTLVDPTPYVLPMSFFVSTAGSSSLLPDETKWFADQKFEFNPSSYWLETKDNIVNRTLFESREFYVYKAPFWADVVRYAGGTVVETPTKHTYVLLAVEEVSPGALEFVRNLKQTKQCAAVLTFDWIFQCLLNRKLLAPEDNRLRFIYSCKEGAPFDIRGDIKDFSCPGTIGSSRRVELMGPNLSPGAEHAMFEEFLAFKLGSKRFEVGDYVILRDGWRTAHQELLAPTASVDLARFGRVRKVFFNGKNRVRVRVVWDRLGMNPTTGILFVTGEMVESDLDYVFQKFVCVPVPKAKALEAMQKREGCCSVDKVDWRDRVFVLGL